MRRNSSSIDAYRADMNPSQQEILEAIREVIFEVAPDIPEGIAYEMLDYPGLANLAVQKHYVALYVAPAVLANWTVSFPGVSAGKSCLRFRNMDQVDRVALGQLLREVRKFRLQKVADCE